MRNSGRPWPRRLLQGLLAALILFSGGAVWGQDDSRLASSHLFYAPWKVEFLNRSQEGACCWLVDRAGNLRADILAGDGGLDQLLDWAGSDGWTIIATAAGEGTMSRWFEEWRAIDPDLRTWVRFLPAVLDPQGRRELPPGVHLLGSGKVLESGRGPFVGVPAAQSYEVPSTQTRPGRRQSLAERGLGRGGPEAVVRLWHADEAEAPTTVTSSRHPGRLTFQPVGVFRVQMDAAVFLPWWPLRGALEFP